MKRFGLLFLVLSIAGASPLSGISSAYGDDFSKFKKLLETSSPTDLETDFSHPSLHSSSVKSSANHGFCSTPGSSWIQIPHASGILEAIKEIDKPYLRDERMSEYRLDRTASQAATEAAMKVALERRFQYINGPSSDRYFLSHFVDDSPDAPHLLEPTPGNPVANALEKTEWKDQTDVRVWAKDWGHHYVTQVPLFGSKNFTGTYDPRPHHFYLGINGKF